MSSPPDKTRPPVTWQTIERVAHEAEVDDLAQMSDAGIDAELAQAGIAPGDVAAALDGALTKAEPGVASAAPAAPPPGRIVVSGAVDKPRAPPSPRRPGVWLGLAVAAVVLALLVWRRDAVVAWLNPPPEEIGPDRPGPVNESPTPRERAAELRREALADCDRSAWGACAAGLDAARAIDPAGEGEARVQAARGRIERAVGGGEGGGEKPPR